MWSSLVLYRIPTLSPLHLTTSQSKFQSCGSVPPSSAAVSLSCPSQALLPSVHLWQGHTVWSIGQGTDPQIWPGNPLNFFLSLSLSDSLGLVAWAKKKTCKPCNLNAIQADLGSISWSRPNQPCPHLFVAFFKMFHEHGNDHIDQHLKYRLFCVNYQDYSQIAPSERKLRRRVEQNIGWHSSSCKGKY